MQTIVTFHYFDYKLFKLFYPDKNIVYIPKNYFYINFTFNNPNEILKNLEIKIKEDKISEVFFKIGFNNLLIYVKEPEDEYYAILIKKYLTDKEQIVVKINNYFNINETYPINIEEEYNYLYILVLGTLISKILKEYSKHKYNRNIWIKFKDLFYLKNVYNYIFFKKRHYNLKNISTKILKNNEKLQDIILNINIFDLNEIYHLITILMPNLKYYEFNNIFYSLLKEKKIFFKDNNILKKYLEKYNIKFDKTKFLKFDVNPEEIKNIRNSYKKTIFKIILLKNILFLTFNMDNKNIFEENILYEDKYTNNEYNINRIVFSINDNIKNLLKDLKIDPSLLYFVLNKTLIFENIKINQNEILKFNFNTFNLNYLYKKGIEEKIYTYKISNKIISITNLINNNFYNYFYNEKNIKNINELIIVINQNIEKIFKINIIKYLFEPTKKQLKIIKKYNLENNIPKDKLFNKFELFDYINKFISNEKPSDKQINFLKNIENELNIKIPKYVYKSKLESSIFIKKNYKKLFNKKYKIQY